MVEQFKSLKKNIKKLLVEIEEGIENFNKDMNFGWFVV
jgi:hypothetical protein